MPITPTNIKLICSDIDGTLLQYGKKTLEAEILSQRRHRVPPPDLPLPGWRV